MKNSRFRLGPMTYEHTLYVVQNMRQLDRDEVFATHYPFTDEDEITDDEYMARMTFESGTRQGFGWVAYAGDEPVAVIGISNMWPGVANVWMMATDRWPLIAFGLTRWAKRAILSVIRSADLHRVQCWSMSGHHVAHRWLRALGAKEECMAPGFGRLGETFHLFAWVKGRDFD